LADPTTRIIDEPAIPEGERGTPASLVLIYGGELGRRYPLGGAESTVVEIGRALTNAIVIEADSVSRQHARLFPEGDGHWVEDLGSTNGTLVNGDRIDGPRRLAHGDLIKIGGIVLRFLCGDDLESRYHEEIYRLTIVDGLTQVHNRRYFDDFLDREVARSGRSGSALSLVLLDLDRFKEINDGFGHLFGDRLLREVAGIVQARVRREQLLARLGGDEFAVVLPDIDLEGAVAFADRVRREIAAHPVTDRGRRLSTTLSIGVAALEPGMSPAGLYERADQSLYAAKRVGRDRVMALQAEQRGA
jgi:diguanylate cyclase (GGDEF)-like protein